MASYKPSREIHIAKPCSESWEAMSGDSRTRHCDACDRDVLNTAAMTPAQIEAILAKPGRLPCMRLVRLDDGALMTAQVVPQTSLVTRAVAAISTAVMMSSAAALAAKPKEHPVTLQGKVVDPTGVPIPGAKVTLHGKNVPELTVVSAADGTFIAHAQRGQYRITTSAAGFETSDAGQVNLRSGMRSLKHPITIGIASATVGEVTIDTEEPNLPTVSVPSTATIPAVPTPTQR